MQIHYTERFLKTAKRLPDAVINDIVKATSQLQNPSAREPLHVYPLEGRLYGLSSLTLNFAYQAIVISSKSGIVFLDIAPRA